MMHHLFVFALVNFAFVAAGLMTREQITGVYTKFNLPATWLVYITFGVALPWLGIVLWHRLRKPAHPVQAPVTTT